jgi:hypothetical protein
MLLDGNMVDMASLTVGCMTAAYRPLRRWRCGTTPWFVRSEVIVDILNGTALVPFILMVGSVFSSELMHQLIGSTRLTMGVGGALGAVFVLGEILNNK